MAHTARAFAPDANAAARLLATPIGASSASSTALQMGLMSRFRRKKQVLLDPIEFGASLPEIDVRVLSSSSTDNDGEISDPVSIREALGSGRSILVGTPGKSFTTTCTETHLPGYVDNAHKLSEFGVDTIAIVRPTKEKKQDKSFVENQVAAWAAKEVDEPQDGSDDKEVQPPVSLAILEDVGGEGLVRELGLLENRGFGVGLRSKRFALVVEDGIAKHLVTDEGTDDCTNTSAENLVEFLAMTPPPGEKVAKSETTTTAQSEMETDMMEMGIDENAGVVLAGVALAIIWAFSSAGDGGSTATATAAVPVVPAVPAVIAKEAANTGMSLLNTYR